jgi:environmental stress-induced protein Ves
MGKSSPSQRLSEPVLTMTKFTNLIYTQIQFAVGSGDVAPFVGHNTFLRWRALQSIAFEEDGRTKFWSESHVSEDFDVSLRVQMQGFTVRMATYHGMTKVPVYHSMTLILISSQTAVSKKVSPSQSTMSFLVGRNMHTVHLQASPYNTVL